MTTQGFKSQRFSGNSTPNLLPLLTSFATQQCFDLDPFQYTSCVSLEQGRSVLVAAPTGAGKTLIATFAIYLAMQQPVSKVFYTAPMKALSNQKFQELVDEYGAHNVGLLTGDTTINSHARIVVMTTEVLRNMLYNDSEALNHLAFVIMDEVHYLADRFRGAVWEEVIIHLPESVRLVSLSATVSNAEEFGDWLQTVRGDTDVIVSEDRPVPLNQHVLFRNTMINLFENIGLPPMNRPNPELVKLIRNTGRATYRHGGSARGSGRRYGTTHGRQPRGVQMNRGRLVHMLNERHLLPAIFFIFSRTGCNQAVRQVVRSGIRLLHAHESEEVRAIVEERCGTLADEDLAVLGYWEWLDGLECGVAAHHAGMLPTFKEVVEELFQKKLIKAIFATETLALGINMPARTVVLEKLDKFNGEARVPITAGEYTQLTGRAGRRGIDVEGHSIIQWHDTLDPQAVASLASRRSYPLNSSFRPTYNMAVNDRSGRERARQILELSFAQFQADRAVVNLARKLRKQQKTLTTYEKSMKCHLGDFTEYSLLRKQLSKHEKEQSGSTFEKPAEQYKRHQKIDEVRNQLHTHPCHFCPEREQHAQWGEQWWRLKQQIDALSTQIRSRTGAVAKTFDHVTDVLGLCGYVHIHKDGTVTLTSGGGVLKRIYGERDLLIAECLNNGAWKNLDPAALAAMACALVHHPRRDDGTPIDPYLPQGPLRAAITSTNETWARLDNLEHANNLPGTEPLSTALCAAMYNWARGSGLESVLGEAKMAAGDFVRQTKQTIDLLDQISVVAENEVGDIARRARDAIRRGIVMQSSVT
jgi:ATP-dependent RNA helicase HelY